MPFYPWDCPAIRGPFIQQKLFAALAGGTGATPAGCNLCLAPDGKTLVTSDINYAGDPGADTIRVYDLETGRELFGLEPSEDRAQPMAFSPDGTRLLTGFARGSAIIWDVRRP